MAYGKMNPVETAYGHTIDKTKPQLNKSPWSTTKRKTKTKQNNNNNKREKET